MRLACMIMLVWVLCLHPMDAFAGTVKTAGKVAGPAKAAAKDGGTKTKEKNVEAGRYDLAGVLKETYRTNPRLRAARAQMRALDEKVPQAQAGYRPTITAGTTVTSTSIDGSMYGPGLGGGANGATSKDFSVNVTQPLFRGFRTTAEVQSARYAVAAQHGVLNGMEQDTLYDVAAAWLDVFRDMTLVNIDSDYRAITKEELVASKRRFAAGLLTRTDVAQAKARFASAEAGVTRAKGTLETSRGRFFEVTGIKADQADIDIKSEAGIAVPADFDAAVTVALEKSPQIITAKALHNASKEDIKDAFGALLPGVEMFGGWDKTLDPQPGLGEKTTSRSIGISVSVPLFQGGATRSKVREAKHNANRMMLEILDAKREVTQNVREAWEMMLTAQAEITSREAQVEAARIARDGVVRESTIGTRSVLDVLDANKELLDAQSALVSARHDLALTKFRLAAVLGELTPENLSFKELEEDFGLHLQTIENKFFGMNVDILPLSSD